MSDDKLDEYSAENIYRASTELKQVLMDKHKLLTRELAFCKKDIAITLPTIIEDSNGFNIEKIKFNAHYNACYAYEQGGETETFDKFSPKTLIALAAYYPALIKMSKDLLLGELPEDYYENYLKEQKQREIINKRRKELYEQKRAEKKEKRKALKEEKLKAEKIEKKVKSTKRKKSDV